ncbi:MAG: DUF2085 domain-containing protein [Candidatus Micrarchaeota archaeon]|nr:DUF2085 domain-containing protein [Candidatus Micrarchaeota archaeon]
MSLRNAPLVYASFLLFLAAFNASIFIAPLLLMENAAGAELIYAAFSPTCHQLTSRSLCIFKHSDGGSLSIGNCYERQDYRYLRENVVLRQGKAGYKLPVCARDLGIYLSMLFGAIILPFFQKPSSQEFPSKWILVAAAIPIGLDGATQLLGLRESSNELRLATGAIIGVVLPFFVLPILNSVAEAASKSLRQEAKR